MDCNSPGQNTGVGSLSLLQEIFPTQGANPGLPHCRRILSQLSHQGSPEYCLRSSNSTRSVAERRQPVAESHGFSLTCVLVSGRALSFRVRRSDRQLPDSLWPSGLLHSSRRWLSHVRLCGEQKGILQHVFQDGWLKLGLLQASQICHVHSGLCAGKETQVSDPLRMRSKARGAAA